MERVRANANRTKYRNEGVDTSNPPTQREIEEGDSSNSQTQREIEGGETSNAPTPGEIRGEETSNPPSPREIGREESLNSVSSREIGGEETTTRNEIGVTIDRDLLDCSICTNPLCPPLYQCILGHIACLSCWEKVQNKCPACNKPIGGQNIALEKVLESIHLPCPNADLGCHQSVSYSQMQMHAKMCEFGPSLCPIPGCAHKAFSGEWRAHFLKDHREPGCYYSYGWQCTIMLNEEDLYYTFL
ncbi:putative E3 ubiquitin-protein ligase SINA-like 6 [Carex rostrata]